MNPNYLFYDTETSGLNHCFDQILQFAAVQTDANFTPITGGETEFRIKLRPDVIPSAGALLTTKMSIASLQQGTSEYEGIKEIHGLCNRAGTISLGYNTISFDDLMLRFAFHRNLLDPYTHQYKNGCGRLDIYPIAILYYLYYPQALNWPEKDGVVSLKLEALNEVNQLASGMAHDALVDVHATIALARRLKASNEQMWAAGCNFFELDWVSKQVESTQTFIEDDQGHRYQDVILVFGRFGAKRNFQHKAICLGFDESDRKRASWLLLDKVDLSSLTQLDQFPVRSSERLDTPPFILPYTLQRDKRPAAYRELSRQNREWLSRHRNLLPDLYRHCQDQTFTADKAIDVDANLYSVGFVTKEDKRILADFHRATIAEKQHLIPRISNETRRALARRLLWRNFPADQLAPDFGAEQESFMQQFAWAAPSQYDYRGDKRLSPYRALADVEAAGDKSTLTEEDGAILAGLEAYILENFVSYP